MFRSALFSIVLSLAVGQNLALLCRTWCDAHVAAASECHQDSSPTRVANGENCDGVAVAVSAALKEDVRRDVPYQDANQAIPVPRYQLAQATIGTRPGQELWRRGPLDNQPFSTALRI